MYTTINSMTSTLISFRLPAEIYDALIAEKEPGESDGTAAIRLLAERLGYTPKAKGYTQSLDTDKIQELVQDEVTRQTSNLAALLTDTRNQLEELKSSCVPKVRQPKATTTRVSSGNVPKVRQPKATTTRVSSGKKLTKVSDKNP